MTKNKKIEIPMIRRVFPELITNDIVGIQPMSAPTGLSFALRYKYGRDRVIIIPYEKVQEDNEFFGPKGHADYQLRREKIIGVEYKKNTITVVKENWRRCNKEMSVKEFKKKYFAEAL